MYLWLKCSILSYDISEPEFRIQMLNFQAKRTLLMKHEAETKTNADWLGLLAHLQSSSVPRKVKSLLVIAYSQELGCRIN
jgi:hypothetical protein